MKIIKSLKAWHQDRKMVSMEKHEIAYIKKLAKKWLEQMKSRKGHQTVPARVSSLEKLCKYVLKKK